MAPQLFGLPTNGKAVPPPIQDAITQGITDWATAHDTLVSSAWKKDDADTLAAAQTYAAKTAGDKAELVRWGKTTDPGVTNLDDATTPGKWPVTRAGVTNRPIASAGELEVFLVGTTVLQRWSTLDSPTQQFSRRKSGDTWSAWATARWTNPSIPGGANLNLVTGHGMYPLTSEVVLTDVGSFTGILEVFPVASVTIQRVITNEATPKTYVRAYRSGAWGAWTFVGWYLGATKKGTDFDTLTQFGEWSNPYTDSPHQPVPETGNLRVQAVSQTTLQTYTTLTGMVYQRTLQGGSWSMWKKTGGFTPAELGVRPPETFKPIALQRVAKPGNAIITEMSKDRVRGWNSSDPSGNLKETTDGGETWTTIKQFPAPTTWVKSLDNGELLVSVGKNEDARQIYLSQGYGTPGVSWSNVLTFSAPYVFSAKGWSLDTHKNIVLLAEYGPKTPTWNGVDVVDPARYVYLSLDYGRTWKKIFDLIAYVKTQGVAEPIAQHVHGVAWDKYWDRIWVTFGDRTNGTVFSDDLGKTWNTAFFGPEDQSPFQVTSIVPMPDCVLFGTDTAPNGVQRISRAAGKNAGPYTIEQAFTIDGDDGKTRTHLSQAKMVCERADGVPVAVFGFGSETNPAPSFIVATTDGKNFSLLWKDDVSQPAGRGVRSIVGPTLSGELIVASDDARETNMWSEWRGRVSFYRNA